MSKKNRIAKETASASKSEASRVGQINPSFLEKENIGAGNRRTSLGRHWIALALIGLAALGVLGAGLKYLEEDARRQIAERNFRTPLNPPKGSLLNAINPFLSPPPPAPTPQLAKEYIYAGSRLLAVEDKNASAAPPADLAVWRVDQSTQAATWYVMGPNGSMQASQQFGSRGDVPLPGDYDGDGKTDFCVFRSNQTETSWYVLKSSDNSFYGVPFGSYGDNAVPADYDGDGQTDIAVYRPGNGTWYAIRSSDQSDFSLQFGLDLSTDTPAPADYDGDGRADVAVWRKTNQTFYSVNSGNGQYAGAVVGQSSTDIPVSGDYDGDGRADYAVKSGSNWIIRYSSTGVVQPAISWGAATDTPVHNDYDGDGKVDIAVWRGQSANPAEVGDWYIRKSSNGQMRGEHWGIAGDIPVPVFYRR